jgi:histidine triad (HIT) family protein
MARAPGCLFCDIVAGDVPTHWVVEEGPIRAFLDHRPLFPGHTLILPADHVDHLNVTSDAVMVPLFHTVRALSRAMVDVLGAEGSFTATNTVVSQSVPHLHVHVAPRRRKDGLKGFFWPRTKYGSEAEAAAVADQLRKGVIL